VRRVSLFRVFSALRLAQCVTHASYVCERLNLSPQFKEMGITLQGLLEMDGEFARKTRS
jgi:hypothetical protein